MAVLLLALVAGSLAAAARLAVFSLLPANAGSREKALIEVHRGMTGMEVTRLLESKGVLRDPSFFSFFGRVTRRWKNLKAGEYEVSPAMTDLQILKVVTSGISVAHPVTVREGENMYEIADELAAKGLASKEKLLELFRDPAFIASTGLKAPLPPTLEGFLFPDTYFFNKSQKPEEMVRQMVHHFLSEWTPQDQVRAQQLGMDRKQIVTLASMIEKETGAPNERPIISSVFYNRLRKHMRLQSDPTTIYGMWARYRGKIHKKDLLEQNLYNTYEIPALPAGPISNPGKESIEAALNPATSDYLFFVSHNDGTHEFTRSLEDHERAVQKFQLDPKAREGKSWRDLNKAKQTSMVRP